MLIFAYLTRRFLIFVVSISFLLAFLFNFIEFFEKLMRAKNVSASIILHFLGLNFIPTLFDLLPIALWLATCLVLKELHQRYEWELLQLLSYIPRRLFVFAFTMGLAVASVAFVLQEQWVTSLASKATLFKQEKLKQGASPTLVSKWLELDHDRFCYFSVLDLTSYQGHDLLLIEMNAQFGLQTIIKAPFFDVDTATNSIKIPLGYVMSMEDHGEREVHDLVVQSPAFFSQLRLNIEVPTTTGLLKTLVFYRQILPTGVYIDLFGQVCSGLAYYVQLLLYPLLTVFLFMLLSNLYAGWAMALSAYPIMLIASLIGDLIFKQGILVGMFVPYILIFLLMLGFFVLKKRTFGC